MAYDTGMTAEERLQAGFDQQKVARQYDEGRARKVVAAAEKAELELAELRGDLLRRSVIRDASVMIVATLTQTLRSLPDQLERTTNLSPAQAQAMQEGIDHALKSMADSMMALSGEKA